jgi:hypothetical protein
MMARENDRVGYDGEKGGRSTHTPIRIHHHPTYDSPPSSTVSWVCYRSPVPGCRLKAVNGGRVMKTVWRRLAGVRVFGGDDNVRGSSGVWRSRI